MIMTTLGAAASKAESRKFLKRWGKEVWKSGDHAVVIYPLAFDAENNTFLNDVVAAQVWGYGWSMDELGLNRVFVPTMAPLDEKTGDPILSEEPILYKASKLFKLYFEGKKAGEINKYKNKNLSKATLDKKLAKIEKKYSNMSPVVGNLRLLIATECIYVPMVNDQPDVDNIKHISQDMSASRAKVVSKIARNKQFYVDMELGYIAVTYDFDTTGDRKQDGKVNPEGITEEYSLHKRFPEIFEDKIKGFIEDLPHASETIAGRHSSFKPASPAAVKQAIQSYAELEADCLEDLIVEDGDNEEILERFKWNFEVIDELGIEITNDLINDALDEAREEAEEKKNHTKKKSSDDDDDDDNDDENDENSDASEVSSISDQIRQDIENAKSDDEDYESSNDEQEINIAE